MSMSFIFVKFFFFFFWCGPFLKYLLSFCYNINSILPFGFLASSHVGAQLPDQSALVFNHRTAREVPCQHLNMGWNLTLWAEANSSLIADGIYLPGIPGLLEASPRQLLPVSLPFSAHPTLSPSSGPLWPLTPLWLLSRWFLSLDLALAFFFRQEDGGPAAKGLEGKVWVSVFWLRPPGCRVNGKQEAKSTAKATATHTKLRTFLHLEGGGQAWEGGCIFLPY